MGTSTSSEHKELHPGELFLERYRIERRIADGGMASIYLAIDEHSGLPVAIKVLFSHYLDNEVVRARFLDEGRIQAMLQHPNIVHVYKVVQDPLLCFVMEYVEGDTLEEYLQREGPLPEAQIIDLMLPVMSAVGLAHTRGIVHRDLKPSNVLLKPVAGFFKPKVMDFGVAKVSKDRDLTAAGTTVGTLHYMSPEQIVGARAIDGRADIYSLGCTLYKLCTGEVPFNASSEFALMMAQVEAPPTPPTQLRAGISTRLEEVILKALAKEPEHRFQSIGQMTSALIELTKTSDAGRTTETRPIPRELIEMAMAANEVAQDQTAQFRLAPLPEQTHVAGDYREAAELATHEMSARAFDEISRDREIAEIRKSQHIQPLKPKKEFAGDDIDATRRAIIDHLPTQPVADPPEFSDEDLSETNAISKERIQRALEQNEEPATREFDRRRSGIIAVDRGVDSGEVTGLHLSDRELRAAIDEAKRAGITGPPPTPATRVDDSDELDRTRDERPSARVPSLAGLADEDSDPTLGARPSVRAASLSSLADEDSDPTLGARPSVRAPSLPGASRPDRVDANLPADSRDTTARDARALSVPHADAPGSNLSRPARAQPLNQHQTKRHKPDESSEGQLWVVGGIIAVFIALLILGWALFLA
ncbi:protein kinase [Lujinxingia vulgaris]|uniref:non-specific serine/threonine protein kinase n=1 Tax=Lujinxingia vulgaris TaxID=2600176 RepID=A0A5C6WX95_9DELT|nr:serine/threonine-protein kinase [Lujinxingia vulgaris]TXD34046.1 protein kinase [Lujinxingia vulgaris]